MRVLSLESLPLNKVLFGSDTHVFDAVSKSVLSRYAIPLLLITQQEMRAGIPSIGPARSLTIVQQLKERGLNLRDTNRSATSVINDLFGCIEDAPISALQCLPARVNGTTTTQLAGLRFIRRLEGVNEHMIVQDILKLTKDELVELGVRRANLDRDSAQAGSEELRLRLRTWDLDLTQRRLRAVS